MTNFTIIIPHYNIPHLLIRCLASIPKRDDLQIIIIDDNSPESSSYLDTYPELKQGNIELIRNNKNIGGGGCRNIGLKHATGKWLIFADADDFFNPCFNDLLNKYIDAEEDVIYFKTNSLDSDTYENSSRAGYMNKRFDLYEKNPKAGILSLRYCTLCPWGKFIKREVVIKHNISFEETPKCNDAGFAYHIGHFAKTVKTDPIALYCITTRKNSVSVVFNKNIRLAVIGVYSRYYSFLKTNNVVMDTPLFNKMEIKSQLLALRATNIEFYEEGLEVCSQNNCPVEYLPDNIDILKNRIKRLIHKT